MATTQNTYTGNGSNKLFSITFPYLETSDIDVYLNNVLQTITTQYSFANATTIEFVTAPPNGATVKIDRTTDDSELSATFFPGSSIKASDLNDNFDQTLYVVQEINNNAVKLADPLYVNKTYIDAADATKVNKSGDTMTGNLAMSGNRVTGLGTPSSDADSATKLYVDQRYGELGVPGLTRWRKTATAGQTVFSGVGDDGNTLAYSASRESVFVNGSYQQRNVDYTANNGTSITITPALLVGDVVDVHCVNNAAGVATDQASGVYFTQSGSGALVRTVDSKLKDVVSVKDFGAVGDGVTDDTAAILAAINSNASFIEVYLPPGTYRLASPLVINRQNLTMTGAGRATTLYPDSGVTAIELAQGNGVSLTVLRDFRIYGNTNATGGIALGGFFVAFCQLHNLSIENFTSSGSFGVKMSKVQELDIFNCYIADNYNNVVFPNVGANYATSVHIHGEAGYIGRALNLGILLEKEAASLTVSDIVIENNDAGGIAVIGKGSQANISRVHFEANTGPNSIYVSGTAAGRAKFTLRDCFFFDEPQPILRTDYVFDSIVEGNVGFVGVGNVITTANSSINFRFNRAEDVSLTQDAIALYAGLLGKVTYTESNTSDGAIVQKVDQVRFPSSQVASADPNTLDDYEEGTWTPSLVCGTSGSITLSAANGRYTKVGNLVSVFATVVVSGVSSPTGELRLSGLPFVVGGFGGGTFAPFAYGLAAGATTSLVGVASGTNSYAVISKYAAGGLSDLAGDVQNGTGVYASFSYLV